MEETNLRSPRHTFRDPAGSVEVRPDGVFRSVRPAYAEAILEFLRLPLASTLVAEGRLVASEVVAHAGGDQPLVLRHPRIAFPSYPWEWSPVLWLAAAELTLNLSIDLLKQGWLLKDATPLNVLFQGTSPVFVDVLSIHRADLRQPIWLAYGQFIRTFLLPMIAHSWLGWPMHAAMMRRDGYEPEEIYSALSWPERMQQPILSSVTLPILLAKTDSQAASTLAARTIEDPEIAAQVIQKTLGTLLMRTRQAMPAHRSSTWSEYAQTATHYSDEDHSAKRGFIAEVLAQCSPARVLDVGCNTGVYSALAADAGAAVVAIDTDLQTVDRLCADVRTTGKNILPLCIDLAQPTPATGWENRECASFLVRCEGYFDTVVMLAVIHHLLLQSQIPLELIASLCARITTRNLILEWVPPTDPKYRELLRGRELIYAHLTEAAFRAAFGQHFELVKEASLANGRILFYFSKRDG